MEALLVPNAHSFLSSVKARVYFGQLLAPSMTAFGQQIECSHPLPYLPPSPGHLGF